MRRLFLTWLCIMLALVLIVQPASAAPEQVESLGMATSALSFSSLGDFDLAYNPEMDEYLMVWQGAQEDGDQNIYAQRLSGDLMSSGEPLVICDWGGDQVSPVIDYDREASEYLVAYVDDAPEGEQALRLQRLWWSGRPKGASVSVSAAAGGRIDGCDIAVGRNACVVSWYMGESAYARGFSRSGAPTGEAQSLQLFCASGAQTSVAYNPDDDQFLVAWEDWAYMYNMIGMALLDGRGRIIGEPTYCAGFNTSQPDIIYSEAVGAYCMVYAYMPWDTCAVAFQAQFLSGRPCALGAPLALWEHQGYDWYALYRPRVAAATDRAAFFATATTTGYALEHFQAIGATFGSRGYVHGSQTICPLQDTVTCSAIAYGNQSETFLVAWMEQIVGTSVALRCQPHGLEGEPLGEPLTLAHTPSWTTHMPSVE